MKIEMLKVLGLRGVDLPFFDAICDKIFESKNEEALFQKMKTLFAVKLVEKGVPFDYGWKDDGMLITYFEEPILFVECDTSFLEKDDD